MNQVKVTTSIWYVVVLVLAHLIAMVIIWPQTLAHGLLTLKLLLSLHVFNPQRQCCLAVTAVVTT